NCKQDVLQPYYPDPINVYHPNPNRYTSQDGDFWSRICVDVKQTGIPADNIPIVATDTGTNEVGRCTTGVTPWEDRDHPYSLPQSSEHGRCCTGYFRSNFKWRGANNDSPIEITRGDTGAHLAWDKFTCLDHFTAITDPGPPPGDGGTNDGGTNDGGDAGGTT